MLCYFIEVERANGTYHYAFVQRTPYSCHLRQEELRKEVRAWAASADCQSEVMLSTSEFLTQTLRRVCLTDHQRISLRVKLPYKGAEQAHATSVRLGAQNTEQGSALQCACQIPEKIKKMGNACNAPVPTAQGISVCGLET